MWVQAISWKRLSSEEVNLFVIAYTMSLKKLMFFPCDLSNESDYLDPRYPDFWYYLHYF